MCGTKLIKHDDFNAGFFEASLEAYGNTGNYVSSPVSVLVLLSALLTAKGPKGDTAKEICEAVVGKRKSYTCVDDPNYSEVVNMLNRIRTGVVSARSADGKQVFTLSNAAFIARTVPFNENFARAFTSFHGDKVVRTLFNTSEGYESINNWANTATNGLIPKYLKSPNEISADTLMVLLNAITFSDNWEKPFEKIKTQVSNFRLSKSKRVQVPMMDVEGQMTYFKDDDFLVLAKPFKNSRFTFVIFLPEKDFDIKEIEDALEDGDFKWNKIKDPSNLRQMHLQLPKFKIEHSLNLKPVLHLLGCRRLFTRGAANLTGISPSAALYAGDAKQVAMMEVDEAGVKAAAVSGVSIMPTMIPPPAKLFRVDQPFYCAIYDTELETPLFIARVVDPSQ